MPASTSRKPTQPTSTEPWVTVPEAARLLGISPPTVLSRALAGEFKVQTIAGRHFVSRESIDAVRALGGER